MGRTRPTALLGAPFGLGSRGLASLVGLSGSVMASPALQELVLITWIFLRWVLPPS